MYMYSEKWYVLQLAENYVVARHVICVVLDLLHRILRQNIGVIKMR
jgi:hypothetical protein